LNRATAKLKQLFRSTFGRRGEYLIGFHDRECSNDLEKCTSRLSRNISPALRDERTNGRMDGALAHSFAIPFSFFLKKKIRRRIFLFFFSHFLWRNKRRHRVPFVSGRSARLCIQSRSRRTYVSSLKAKRKHRTEDLMPTIFQAFSFHHDRCVVRCTSAAAAATTRKELRI